MIKRIYILSFIALLCSTCKKKTTITARVFNPALNEYLVGAVVSLLETKTTEGVLGGIGAKEECNEIATAITNSEGRAYFDMQKLRSGHRYRYKLGLKETWGIAKRNPCATLHHELEKGKNQEIMLHDYMELDYCIEYNPSYLEPSIPGDYLDAVIAPIKYKTSSGYFQGGGGGEIPHITYEEFYPITKTTCKQRPKMFACRLAVTTRRRKMGIVSTSVDTVRMYPNKGVTVVRLVW